MDPSATLRPNARPSCSANAAAVGWKLPARPYKELPFPTVALPPGRRLSVAETLRIGLRPIQKRDAVSASVPAK
jgi:hypothetical protein